MKKYLYYKGIDLYFLFVIDDVTNLNILNLNILIIIKILLMI